MYPSPSLSNTLKLKQPYNPGFHKLSAIQDSIIAICVLAVPFEINYTIKVSNLEM